MLEVAYRPRALFDLESIVVYIGDVLHSPSSARKTYNSIVETIAKLSETPGLGKTFADSRLEGVQYRSFLAGNYRVFYSYDATTLTVWRMLHTKQDIDDMTIVDW
ncbi:MAG: type II toxin-antitoxin system RelE/ParE family toxin [Eggerthellaceae bacterium]|nr:type II toxin-antitoxin system RelE/ParE family toxin [Eggerthellaceae bacterium]